MTHAEQLPVALTPARCMLRERTRSSVRGEQMIKRLNLLVSLITDENDYQLDQAAVSEEAARRLGVNLQVLFAGGDAITQSTQLLKAIQSAPESRPDGILLEPAGGTALPQVARAAASAGIGWAILNREVDYLAELRRTARSPVFTVTSDHEEIGRIQGRQFAVLLPRGGSVLYIQGPSEHTAAKQRTLGMQETKPENIQVTMLRGQWTEGSAHRTVSSWLRLTTSQKARMDLIGCQNDVMAMGARKAFQEGLSEQEKERWLHLPYTGCDGVAKTGQAWVRGGQLTATIIVPANTGQAIDMMVQGLKTGKQPKERTFIAPVSFPSIESLASSQMEKTRTR